MLIFAGEIRGNEKLHATRWEDQIGRFPEKDLGGYLHIFAYKTN
jgi:hypothetical protein